MCNACFDENKLQTTTTFSVDCNGCIIVIKNVPCLECKECGEITFTEEVSARLEKLVNMAKSLTQELSVIDYSKVA